MTGAPQWFVVYTKPRWEKKVHASLTENGITAYCPLNKEVRQWSDRKKTVSVPLFSSYVFVCIPPAMQTQVRMIPGIINFVYYNGRIAVVRDEEMLDVQQFISSHNQVRVERLDYRPGDVINLDHGPFRGQDALISTVGKNRLELILKSLELKLVVDIRQ